MPQPVNRLMPVARAYQPTLRDRVANRLLGLMGDGYQQQRFVENLIGSTGVGHSKTVLADYLGLTAPFQADEAGRQIATPGNRLMGAANLALAAMPVPLVAKGANKLFQEARAAVAPIRAYHGSPHQFDEFDVSKIGTGEGAQAFGRGLYFAEKEEVARSYRDALALPSSAQNDVAKHWLREAEGDKGRAIQLFAQHAESAGLPTDEVRSISKLIDGGGHMYEVGIHAEPADFLDWDATLDQQSPQVRGALADLLGDDRLRAAADRSVYDASRLSAPFDPRTGQTGPIYVLDPQSTTL